MKFICTECKSKFFTADPTITQCSDCTGDARAAALGNAERDAAIQQLINPVIAAEPQSVDPRTGTNERHAEALEQVKSRKAPGKPKAKAKDKPAVKPTETPAETPETPATPAPEAPTNEA